MLRAEDPHGESTPVAPLSSPIDPSANPSHQPTPARLRQSSQYTRPLRSGLRDYSCPAIEPAVSACRQRTQPRADCRPSPAPNAPLLRPDLPVEGRAGHGSTETRRRRRAHRHERVVLPQYRSPAQDSDSTIHGECPGYRQDSALITLRNA